MLQVLGAKEGYDDFPSPHLSTIPIFCTLPREYLHCLEILLKNTN